MLLRTLALAVALGCGVTSGTAFAAKRPPKIKTIKPKKDKRFKDSKVVKVKPRKARKRSHS